MNVKINYTLDLEDIPAHLKLLIHDISAKIELVRLDLFQAGIDIVDAPHRISEINLLRKRLAILDSALEDCYSIGTAYAIQKLGIQQDAEQKKELDE